MKTDLTTAQIEAYAKAFATVWHKEREAKGAKEAHRLARKAGMKALGVRKPKTREA